MAKVLRFSRSNILLPGDFTQVKPGCIHQFEGVEDGVAFELYWAEFNHGDIKRRTVGSYSRESKIAADVSTGRKVNMIWRIYGTELYTTSFTLNMCLAS